MQVDASSRRKQRLWNVEDRGIGVARYRDDAAKRAVARQRSLTVLVSIITGTPCSELIFSFTGHLLHLRRAQLAYPPRRRLRVSDLDDRLLLPTLENYIRLTARLQIIISGLLSFLLAIHVIHPSPGIIERIIT